MKKMIIIGLMLLLLADMGYAANNVFTCLDADVSQENITIYNATDNSLLLALSKNITCGDGCNTNTGACNAVGVTDVGIVIAIPLIVIVLAYLGINFAKEEWTMQMLLLIIGMFLLVLDVGIAMDIMQNMNTDVSTMLGAGYWALIGTTMLVVLYFFLRVIVTAINVLEKGK